MMGDGRKKGGALILVANDDGIHAAGLKCLAASLKKLGRVVVVAPDKPMSASSHSITLHRPLRVGKIAKDVFAIDGTPADCIMLGINGILLRRPDIVVAGINHGANLGDDVHYSGTVSAAHEGGIFGVPAVAVSLAADKHKEGLQAKHFKFSADIARKITKKVLDEGLPAGTILNVNIPHITAQKIKGCLVTKQGKRDYGNVIVEKVDPRGRKYYWIGGDLPNFEDIPESDCNAIRGGYVSITPLKTNSTDLALLRTLKKWRF